MFHFWRVSKDAQNPFSSRYGPIWDPIWDPIWGHDETYWRPLWTTPMAHILVPVGTPHSGCSDGIIRMTRWGAQMRPQIGDLLNRVWMVCSLQKIHHLFTTQTCIMT